MLLVLLPCFLNLRGLSWCKQYPVRNAQYRTKASNANNLLSRSKAMVAAIRVSFAMALTIYVALCSTWSPWLGLANATFFILCLAIRHVLKLFQWLINSRPSLQRFSTSLGIRVGAVAAAEQAFHQNKQQ